MNKKELFEKKGFDQNSIKFLNNFLYEFNDLFGKYLSEEEVLERINDYLDEIEFADELDGCSGCYKSGEKKVYVKRGNSEFEKSVFFHEMVHVIYQKLENDYSEKIFTKILEDDFELEEQDGLMLGGIGIDEGFTQYITSKRDEKYCKKGKFLAYPILTEQFSFLANIVGEDDLINGMFNSYEQVEMVLRKNLDWEPKDCDEYCSALGKIYTYENEVLESKSKEELLLEKIFGIKKRLPKDVESAIDEVVKKYLMQTVNTVDDFYVLVENMKKYAQSLGKDVREEMAIALYNQYKKHPEFNLEESNPELCRSFIIYEKLDEFDNLSLEEKLKYLADDNELQRLIQDNQNSSAFKKIVVQHMHDEDEYTGFRLDRFVRNNHQLSDYNALYGMLTTGLLQEKIQNGEVNLESLALEWIQSDDYQGGFSLFNLFDVNGKSEKYLGTYALSGWNCDELIQYEIAKLSMEERRKQVSKICKDVYDRDMENSDLGKYIFMCDKSSKDIIYACSIENQWMNVEDVAEELYDKPEYISSITEGKIKHIKGYINKEIDIENAIILSLLRNAGVLDDTVIDEYIRKFEKQYLTPDDIELEVDRQNISVREIKEKVKEISERLDAKRKGHTLLIGGGENIEK